MLAFWVVGIALGATHIEIAAAAPKQQSSWVEVTNSKVRLVGATVTQDGEPARYAAVQLRMKPGWKTYWRNPGDSGVPPAFDWTGSKNLKEAEVLYPIPHRFSDAGGTAIGYSGDVTFPVKIVPENPDEPVELSLVFDFGLCKDLCIPNAAKLKASIPVEAGAENAQLIEKAMTHVPPPVTDGGLPRIAEVAVNYEGKTPGLEVDVLFPEEATDTDLFIVSPDVVVPVPKMLGPLEQGKQRFAVVFFSEGEAAAIKGKPLTMTLVSDAGAAEAVWTAK